MASSTLGPVGYINPAPVTTSWENPAIHPFNRFFGGVTLSPELHPYDAYDETTWTLPEALKGQSKFLGQTFELLALMQNSFLLTVILPLVRTNEIQAHWSRWEFPAFIPDLVPHMGVVRFVKSNRISGKSTMARYGIGIFLEHGFMNTPEGIAHYSMNIRQVLAAVIEGMQFEALQALINVGSYETALARKVNPSNTNALATSMKAAMSRELFAWGCLQQNSNAWALMDKKINEITQTYLRNRDPFTHYITSTKIDAFIRQIPHDQVTASIFGPDAQRKIRDGVQDFRVDDFGNRIFSSRPFLLDDKPVDPFERKAQIGEYVRCYNHIKEQMDKYTTAARTQYIYDEKKDSFQKITLPEKVDNCHRFDKDGKLLHVRDARKRGNINEKNFSDFLHYTHKDQLHVVRYMLHIDQKDFNVSDYRCFVTTFYNALKKRYGRNMADYDNAIRELRDMLRILGTYSYDAEMDAWLQVLARKNTDISENNSLNKNLSTEAGSFKNNIWGSLDIPTNAEIASFLLGAVFPPPPAVRPVIQGKWVLPPTHGDYGGFKTISDIVDRGAFPNTYFSSNYGNRVRDNLKIFEELADGINMMLPGCVTASPKFVNGSIHFAGHRHALFENLVSLGYSPRYLFLHQANADVNTRVNVAGGRDREEFGRRDGDFAGRRVDESMFPKISQSRNFLMNKIIGNLTAADSMATEFIGEAIGYPEQAGKKLRYTAVQTPTADVKGARNTIFVEQRAAVLVDGGNADSGLNFDGVLAAPKLSSATSNANFEKTVYDTIVRWTFLPAPADPADAEDFKKNVNFYTVHTLIVFALAMVKIESAGSANRIERTYQNAARIIDAVQETLNVKLHDTATPDDDGRYAAAITAMGAPDALDRLVNALGNLYQETNGSVFNNHVTLGGFGGIRTELETHKRRIVDEYASDPASRAVLNRPAADLATTAGYAAHRNANLSLYKPAPISLGRNAMITYVNFAKTGAGVRRAIPVSFNNSSNFMSERELDDVERLWSAGFGNLETKKTVSRDVGIIFAPSEIFDDLKYEIGLLPLIKNAESRIQDREEKEEERRDTMERVARETSASAVQSRGGLQALIGGLSDSGTKRRRTDYSRSNQEATLPGIPASQKSFFKNEQITTNMEKMYTSLVKTFLDQPASMIIAVSYGFTPFTKQLLESTIVNDLDHPVDYLIVRPHATFTTVGVIKMIPGLETGQMCFGNIIAEVGDDAAIQTHLVTETHYQGALIKKPNNICVLNDVLVSDYHGGLATDPIDIEAYDPSTGKFGATPAQSIIYMMISRNDVMSSDAFSLLGSAVWVNRDGKADKVDRAEGFGYGAADYYNAVWGFRKHRWDDPSVRNTQDSKYLNQVVVPNSIVFRSVALYFDPMKGNYVRGNSEQTGHFRSHTVGNNMHRARIGETSFKNVPINPLEYK